MNSRNGRNLVKGAPMELRPVALYCGNGHCQYTLDIVSRMHTSDVAHRADQQPCTDEQRQRQRCLKHRDHAEKPSLAAAGARTWA